MAVLVVGTAAPLAKVASDMHPITLAFGRLGLAFVLLSIVNHKSLPKPVWRATAYSGVALAIHFLSWFISLQHTSVIRSTLLVCSTPLWIGLWTVLKGASVPKPYWIGVCVSLLGVYLMGADESVSGVPWSFFGEGCAVLGGIMGAVYLVLSEQVRADTDNTLYAKWVCGVAAFGLLLAMLIWKQDISMLQVPRQLWWIVMAMAVGPQIMGHAGLSYCMKWIPAHLVGLSLLAEPVVAGGIAWLLLDESITLMELIGGSVVLIGLFLGIRSQP